MNAEAEFNPQKFAVVGAGPVGCIVAAFLAKSGYEVILCDVIADLLKPALDPGIKIEGAENIQQKVSKICTNVDELKKFQRSAPMLTNLSITTLM
jgi:2-dehydropantoate 2-reductase